MDRYDIVCIHTIVGFAPAHAAHFSVHHDGRIDQSRDTRYRSGANLDGNYRVIAIENEDHGPAYGTWNVNNGHAVPAFTPAQVEANARILAWAHQAHGVPLQLCPNSRSTSRGLAYHRQGIDGNFATYAYPGRVSGGELWTASFGKVCPGDRRISARDVILARAKQIVNGEAPEPEPEPPAPILEDDMQLFLLGASAYRAQFGDRYLGVPKDQAELWLSRGVKALPITAAYDAVLRANLTAEVEPVDEQAPPVP
jgi:N-acetylmuramoyl-L-alanine amidase